MNNYVYVTRYKVYLDLISGLVYKSLDPGCPAIHLSINPDTRYPTICIGKINPEDKHSRIVNLHAIYKQHLIETGTDPVGKHLCHLDDNKYNFLPVNLALLPTTENSRMRKERRERLGADEVAKINNAGYETYVLTRLRPTTPVYKRLKASIDAGETPEQRLAQYTAKQLAKAARARERKAAREATRMNEEYITDEIAAAAGIAELAARAVA